MSLVSSLFVMMWAAFAPAVAPLRVCSVSESLPYSTRAHDGLDDRIAAVIAADLRRSVEYVTQPRRRAFALSEQDNDACDLIMGVPEGARGLLTTTPYYRSSYVFVARRTQRPPVRSFDDPRLRQMRIGIQLAGDEGGAAPTGRALAVRGLSGQVRGFPMLGVKAGAGGPSDGAADAQRAVVGAVVDGAVDVAAVWGPVGGYFAAASRAPLVVSPIEATPRDPAPFSFGIAIGVQPGQAALRDRVNQALVRHAGDIIRIVRRYHVPEPARPATSSKGAP